MKGHFKASAAPMHATGTMKADTPHHLAPEAGSPSHEHVHLQPGHMMAGGGGGGMPAMGGGDKEPDPSDPNEAAEGESPMGGVPPMMGGGRGRKGY